MSLWRKFQIDNAENMLCVNVACHSNGVFFFFFVFFYLASFWQPWYCAMCLKKKKKQLFSSHRDELMYTRFCRIREDDIFFYYASVWGLLFL